MRVLHSEQLVFADMNMTLAKYALCANIQNKLEAEEDESYYIYSF